jgi:predicted O-linked N-acetylglucosamine transferase (SPINDLY family)
MPVVGIMSASGTEVLRTAWELCTRGRFDDAQRTLSGHLERSPEDVDAWTLLAKLCLQRRDHMRAMAAAGNATRLQPTHAEALYTLGRAHRANGTLKAAEECYRRALAAAPDHAGILTSLGVLLRARGQTDEAIALYRRALAVNPNHAEAANNLGNALAAIGAADEARQLHGLGRPVLAAQLAELRRTVDALLAAGKQEDARTVLSDALRIAPQDPDLWLNAGKLDCALGRDQTGLDCVEEAARLDPNSIEANEIARNICVAGGLYERAVHYSDRMLELSPTPDIVVTKQLLLPCIQQSRESIRETRARYAQGLAEALSSDTPLQGPAAVPGKTSFFVASHTAFYLAYHGENNRELQIDLARMYLKRMPELAVTAEHCSRAERRPGRLRVGFISRFLCKHSIGATTRGLIDRLSREAFEVYALRITPAVDDETTQLIRASADHAVDLEVDLAKARRQIAALELDVLFYQDIGMEPRSYLLAFARLAPVQCLSFGHPDTTGIPTMDYFVSNDLFEPAGAQAHYSEELFLLQDLPTLAYYYKPRLPKAPVSRERWGFTTAETLYVCPQTLFKVHPEFDELLQGILMRDPNAVPVFIDGSFKEWSESLRARFRRAFPAAAHRIRFVPRQSYAAFLELLAVADVILDTPHFNGMNTSLEAFALGKPVVTWPGTMQRGRHTQAMYRKMGLLDAIAADARSYVDIAVRLGTDRAYARSFSERILAKNSALYEDPRVVREFERFFLEAVGRRRLRGAEHGSH